MTRIRQLPRLAFTWSLMLLTVIVGGVRPSCICPDGSLCFVCPKLLASHCVPSGVEASAAKGSCGASCGCEHSAIASRSESAASLELAGRCDGYDCLVIAPASPATVPSAEEPIRPFSEDGVVPLVASYEPFLDRQASPARSTQDRAGPPPDLIVLFQRWLI